MIHKISLLFLLLAWYQVSTFVHAQVISPRSSTMQFDRMMEKGTVVADVNYDNIKGSAFLNKEFVSGTLYMKNGMIFEEIPFRYNIYADQIEFKKGEEILAFTNPNELDHVVFDGRIHIFGTYYLKGKLIKGYYQMLTDGECRLLVRRSSIIKREQLPASDFAGGNYRDYFREEIQYFLSRDGRNLIPIRKNTKSLLKVLSDKQDEIKQFISEGKLDVRNDEDLGEVVFFYNKLKTDK